MSTYALPSFEAVASQLGLRLSVPKLSWWQNNDAIILHGTVDGVPVVVQQGFWGSFVRVFFHGAIEPASDLGLSISLREAYWTDGATLTEADLPGTPRFEQSFKIDGLEPLRARTLLTPPVHAALIAWHNARRWERVQEDNALEFWISDESVLLAIDPGYFKIPNRAPIKPEEMVTDIRATIGLVKAISASLSAVPPSAMLAPHLPGWQAFAAQHGLGFTASPLRVFGSFAGVAFSARAAVFQGAYAAELSLRFTRPLPFYLHVAPTAHWYEITKTREAFQDAAVEEARAKATGDSAFDGKLRLLTSDPEPALALVGTEVRAGLLALFESQGYVHLSSTGLTVRARSMIPPESFPAICAQLADLEKKISAAAFSA